MSKPKKIAWWPVMASKCPSCPFRYGGDKELRNRVMERVLFDASQIFHHPRIHGKKQTHLCRGARDEQLVILHRLGWIAEPTDAAFKEASRRAGVQILD